MRTTDPGGSRVATVPRTAVQTLGNRTVVYVVDAAQPGQFVEREVTLGKSSGDTVEVLSGLMRGEDVVAQGSFFVRAERERVGPSARMPPLSENRAPAPGAQSQSPNGPTVRVTERGFEPDRVAVPQGTQAAITFIRTTDNTCGTEIVIPSQDIKRALPLNQPVTIAVETAGREIGFVCGMNMFKGTIVVQ